MYSIEVTAVAVQSALPDPSTIWAWAHTHLNFKAEGATPDAVGQLIQAQLDANPNLGCSRILCPRRLQAETNYTAFLVPSFEKGRLSGLGKEADAINDIANTQASWSKTSPVSIDFLVYYDWEFGRKDVGDVESHAG